MKMVYLEDINSKKFFKGDEKEKFDGKDEFL